MREVNLQSKKLIPKRFILLIIDLQLHIQLYVQLKKLKKIQIHERGSDINKFEIYDRDAHDIKIN